MSNDSSLVAVVDIGKSNAKLMLVDTDSSELIWSTSQACAALSTKPFRQLNVAGIERWLLAALAAAPERHRIQTIVPIAHGATAVLLDRKGALLVAPDYEDPEFNSVAAEYGIRRDPFTSTFSPELPQGLNLGRQLYYLQSRIPELFASCHHIVLYPQYWAFRLCGVLASEITSLGCHTDLWDLREDDYSDLALQMDWPLKFPPLRQAAETLATIQPELANRLGLDVRCRVLCGLHDSNASYLCHLINRPVSESFSVISSGTWTVVMARGIDLQRLRPEFDMLANIDVSGSPFGTARFMGGREYAAIADVWNPNTPPTLDGIHSIIANETLAVPCFSPVGGPFAGSAGRYVNADNLSCAHRASLATLYVALMSDILLEMLDVGGDILIDGPLAANPLFGQLLATLRPRNDVRRLPDHAGAATAALSLAGFRPAAIPSDVAKPLSLSALTSYRAAWRECLPFNPAR